jgi:hypothetical protein
MDRCFLDANVVADYILLNELIKEKKTIEEKEAFLKGVEQNNPGLFFSFGLIESIRLAKFVSFEFFISNYVISETTSVIIEEYSLKEFNKGMNPLKYWFKRKEKQIQDLKQEQIDDLTKLLSSFHAAFVDTKLIKKSEEAMIADIVKFRTLGCHTEDSHLLSQATYKNIACKYFVSKDSPLKKNTKAKSSISAVNPQKFMEIAKIGSQQIHSYLSARQ